MRLLSEFALRSEFADADLLVLGQDGLIIATYPVSMIVLASKSEYFNALLTGPFSEAASRDGAKRPKLRLPEGYLPTTVEAVVRLLYGDEGASEGIRTLDELEEAMRLVRFLGASSLEPSLAAAARRLLSAAGGATSDAPTSSHRLHRGASHGSNERRGGVRREEEREGAERESDDLDGLALSLLEYGYRYAIQAVCRLGLEHVERNFESAAEHPLWCQLSPEALLLVLDSDSLAAASEDRVLRAALAWRASDPPSRVPFTVPILSRLRLRALLSGAAQGSLSDVLDSLARLKMPEGQAAEAAAIVEAARRERAENPVGASTSGRSGQLVTWTDKLPLTDQRGSPGAARHGDFVALGSMDGQINVHRISSGARVAALSFPEPPPAAGHPMGLEFREARYVWRLAFSEDGGRLAAVCVVGVMVWNTRDWNEAAYCAAEGDKYAVSFADPQGRRLLFGGESRLIRVLDVDLGRITSSIRADHAVWDLQPLPLPLPPPSDAGAAPGEAMSDLPAPAPPEQCHLVCTTNMLGVCNAASGAVREVPGLRLPASRAAAHGGGLVAFVVYPNRSHVYDTEAPAQVRLLDLSLPPHPEDPTAGRPRTPTDWALILERSSRIIHASLATIIWNLRFSPDGSKLAIVGFVNNLRGATFEGSIEVLEVRTGEVLVGKFWAWPVQSRSSLRYVTWLDEARLVVVEEDGAVHLVGVPGGERGERWGGMGGSRVTVSH